MMTITEIDKLVDSLPDLQYSYDRYVIVKEGVTVPFEYLLTDGTLFTSNNSVWNKGLLKEKLMEGYRYIGLGRFHRYIG